VTLLTAVLATYWHHTCQLSSCWRLGRFAHGHLKLCAHHHPLVPSDGRVTQAEIDAVTRSMAAPGLADSESGPASGNKQP
jgi:hypothetical protein